MRCGKYQCCFNFYTNNHLYQLQVSLILSNAIIISEKKKKNKLLEQMGLIDFHLQNLIKINEKLHSNNQNYQKEISTAINGIKAREKKTKDFFNKSLGKLKRIFNRYTREIENDYNRIEELISKFYLHLTMDVKLIKILLIS